MNRPEFSFCYIHIECTPGVMSAINYPPGIPDGTEDPTIVLNESSDDHNFGVQINFANVNPADVNLVVKGANWLHRAKWILTWTNGTVGFRCEIVIKRDVKLVNRVKLETSGNQMVIKAARMVIKAARM